ncbi:MAG: DUF3108 domain-containing protein [Paracoccaceae bacterium]
MIRHLQQLLLAGALGFSAMAAGAETADFDVTLKGLKVAELSLTSSVAGGDYDVQLTIRSEGLAGVVKRVRFAAAAQGGIGNSFAPVRYVEKADTGRRQSDVEIVYDGGVPQVLRYTSPRKDGPELLDPATQGGTLDPATALYVGLRDLPAGQSCAADFAVFDGRRRSAFSLSGDGVTCTGSYRRIAGYTSEEMAERTRFPIEMTYAPEEGVMRVIEASVQTIYGKVRLKRR